MRSKNVLWLFCCLLGVVAGNESGTAGQEVCSSCVTTGVVSVIVTLLLVAALQAGGYLLWKAYWRGKTGQHLVSDPEKGDSIYAFDNPGFKEGPILQAEEKDNQKVKWAHWSAITPHNPNKLKAMDDSFTAPRLKIVPLRSQDFTGLGFNVCGNMRDGIFVKDLLHRGPASESGRILPGDRIESVKISVRHMVLEDALTILSYASPYEVELALEEHPPPLSIHHPHHNHHNPNNSHPRRICHPFYRSRSISDLTTIGKSANNSRLRVGDEEALNVSLEENSRQQEGDQNTRNTIIEDTSSNTTPSQVKSLITKGIHHLRDRLLTPPSPQHTLSQQALEEREDPVAAKRNKRKAPIPPQSESGAEDVPDMQTEEEPHHQDHDTVTPPDTDSETGATSSNRIELDDTHITVHHAAEHTPTTRHTGRKTCSLGDLSRYQEAGGSGTGSLERAASLDLDDGQPPGGGSASNRKRKAPPPPVASSPPMRPASVWGTLQEALLHDSDADDSWDEDSSHITQITVTAEDEPHLQNNGSAVKPARAPPPSRIPVRAHHASH